MMKRERSGNWVSMLAALAAATALAWGTASAAPGSQVRLARDFGAQDMGLSPSTDVKRVTLTLTVPNRTAMVAYAKSTVDRSSPNFRKFLNPSQFAARFGQSDAQIAQVTSLLAGYGITVTQVHANKLILNARATNAQLTRAFGSPIHSYQLAGQKYQRPVSAAQIPAALQGLVASVAGLSTQAVHKPFLQRIPAVGVGAGEATVGALKIPRPGAAANAILGQLTTADVSNLYNVGPLYARGITGAGVTLGIMTFASFNPTDAKAYWTALGLSFDPNRIEIVAASDPLTITTDGAEETTLDVEQSGGLAPGAKIIVYEAANTDAGAIDLYSTAINDNRADTLSISWGLFEIAYGSADLAPFDVLFYQAAIAGIPVIASSGDAGAYDVNRNYAYPTCTTILSVDFPASHPLVLAAGGTTLPGVIPRRYGTVTVPAERPWGWDYLRDYYVSHYGQQFYYDNVFPVGGGGGVSVNYDLPWFQVGTPGTQVSPSAQALFCNTPSGVALYTPAGLPSGYAGRNVPDISLNADPFTGYLLYYGGTWYGGGGGTSFVAPQLNGIFALITEDLRTTSGVPATRVGFPNSQLYAAFANMGYGPGSPFRPLIYGSNLYWNANSNFNPAAGIGTLNVDNLAKALR